MPDNPAPAQPVQQQHYTQPAAPAPVQAPHPAAPAQQPAQQQPHPVQAAPGGFPAPIAHNAPVAPPAMHPGQPQETFHATPSPHPPVQPESVSAAPGFHATPARGGTDGMPSGGDEIPAGFVKIRWVKKIGGNEADEEISEERRAHSLVASGHAELVEDEKKK